MTHEGRPADTEYAPYFARYVALVPEDDVIAALESQGRETAAVLAGIDETKAAHRYAEGKWSIKEVVGHVGDAERVFSYRALCIARGETQSLPGYEEQTYTPTAKFDRRTMSDLADDLAAVRRATLALLHGLDDEAWGRSGVANEAAVSVRALAYMMLGHERHHLGVLRERYL